MSDDDFEFDEDIEAIEAELADERRRMLAVDHLLFETIAYFERKSPGLLDHLDASVENLGDMTDDDTRDDDAVREIAHTFLAGLRERAKRR